MAGAVRKFTLRKSDGSDECATCAVKIRKGSNFVLVRLRLLHPDSEFNVCLGCISEVVLETKKRV